MTQGTPHTARPPKRADRRPYVRDAGRYPEGALAGVTLTMGFVLLALACGFVIGLAVFALMNLSTWLTSLLWDGAGGALGMLWFPLLACTLGGAIIGVWTWYARDSVKPLEEVLETFRKTGSYRTNGVARPVVSFLLPLVFGGSVGFEAGLTGIIASGCCWVRDRLKAAGLRAGAVADVTIAASIAAIFATPLAGIVAGAQSAPGGREGLLEEPDVDGYNMRRGVKVVLYTAAAFGAFGGVALFRTLFETAGGLPHFEAISAGYTEYLWAIPCLALAYLMALVYYASARLFGTLSARLGNSMAATIAKPVLAGIIMGAVAIALPYVLFSGELQSEELMGSWTSWTAVALIATGVLKAAITPLCLNMGWMGGNLFPSIFAGVAAGYGLAQLSGADPMLMVTVTATAFLAGVVRKPLLTLAILFLCFPAEGLFWMGLAAVIGASLPLPRVLLAKAR